MAQIAYILLGHKDPAAIIAQARRLTAAGDVVAIHFDGRAPAAEDRTIRAALADDPRIAFAPRRIRCGWGSWSLVAATLMTIRAALAAFPGATHVYMLSGDCMPVKSAAYIRRFLDAAACDHIEGHDFFASNWIRTGLKEERLIYGHYVNERTQRRLFYLSIAVQKRLGLRRAVPDDLQVMIGSQWWCLRRSTIEAVLAFCDRRPDVIRFFRRTWIPDETFFQTIVRQVVPDAEIRNCTLTFLMFSDYGMPVRFYDDHYDFLIGQDYLFARKISPEARDLKRRLGELHAADRTDFATSGEGRDVHAFLTGRGRVGRRYAPRAWESGSTFGGSRELLIVSCKKWHVAKRLAATIGEATQIPSLSFLFDEAETPLPDLGGIERSLAKRGRHRRAVLRMLFDRFETDRLLICLDPSAVEAMADFEHDRSTTRILHVECDVSDAYLAGHARRVGLAAPQTPPAILASLLPAIRRDFAAERDAIEDAGFAHLSRLAQDASPVVRTAALAAFLSGDPGTAERVARAPHVFND